MIWNDVLLYYDIAYSVIKYNRDIISLCWRRFTEVCLQSYLVLEFDILWSIPVCHSSQIPLQYISEHTVAHLLAHEVWNKLWGKHSDRLFLQALPMDIPVGSQWEQWVSVIEEVCRMSYGAIDVIQALTFSVKTDWHLITG